jgi:hypothetical protein
MGTLKEIIKNQKVLLTASTMLKVVVVERRFALSVYYWTNVRSLASFRLQSKKNGKPFIG